MFITADDLKNALGPSTFLTIFDDLSTGSVPAAPVDLIIKRAHAEVMSYLPRVYDTMPAELPAPVPAILMSAELDYAVAFSFERHPEYVRTFGEQKRLERWNRAEKKMERIASAIQEIAPNDSPPEGKPRTSGGIVYDNARRMLIDSPDGTFNGGDF